MVRVTTAGVTHARQFAPPTDTPPVILSVPVVPTFVEGTPGTHDFTQYVSDDGVSTVVYSLTNVLPTGFVFTSATGILSYDGAGAPSVSQHSLVATDDVGSATSALFNLTIQAVPLDPSAWPVNGWAAQGGYMISNQDLNMSTDPYRTWNGEKDVLIYQWRYQDAARQTFEKAFLVWFDANHPHCKISQYIVASDVLKEFSFDARWQTAQLIDDGTNGDDTWYLKNASGVQVEANFDPVRLWKGNEADTVVDTNALGETFSAAFHRTWYQYLSAQDSVPLIDGLYHDVTPPIPERVWIDDGATQSGFDYEEDGSNTDDDSNDPDGGGTLFRTGILQWRDSFYQRFGVDKAYWGNITRQGLDYTDGAMTKFPVSSNEFYGQWDGGIFEHCMGDCNIEANGVGYDNDGGGDPVPNKFFNRLALIQSCLKPDATNPWGKSMVLLDCNLNNPEPFLEVDYDAYRMMGGMAALSGSILGGQRHRALPAEPLDEFVYDWGVLVGVNSMGTLNDADATFTLRAADYTDGGAEFHWIEFENVLWVVRTDWYPYGTSTYGTGTAADCVLPSPGTGKKWIHPDLSSYTNTTSGRSTRGQNNTLNSGGDVNTGGSYGTVSLLPAHAVMLTKKASSIDGYPFVYVAIAMSHGTERPTTNPWKTAITYANVYIAHALGYNSSEARLVWWNVMGDLRATNPGLIIVQHVNYLGISLDVATETNKTGRWKETLMFADSANFDDWTMKDSNGRYFTRNVVAVLSTGGPAFHWDCSEDIKTQLTQRTIDDWSDFDNPGDGNCMRDYNYWIMEDTIPETPISGRYWRAKHQEAYTVISSNEFDVPLWSGAVITGGDIGNGYFALLNAHSAGFLRTNRTDGSIENIVGIKTVSGKTRVLTASSPNYGAVNGDLMVIWPKIKGDASRSDYGSMTQAERNNGIKNFFNNYRDEALAQYGGVVGAVHNGAANEYAAKRLGVAVTAPDLWAGYWEYKHFEFYNKTIGFHPDETNTFIATRPLDGFPATAYDPIKAMLAMGLAQLGLTTNEESAGGYPGVMTDIHLRNNNLSFDPTQCTQTDIANGRFFACMAWCMENVYPNCEFFYSRFQEDHAHPMMFDEYIIHAGSPITTRNFGVYDPDGNAGLGEFTFYSPDFGTYGYIKEFENCCIVINLRAPTNNAIPWIPSWVSGGQAIDIALDRATLPSAGSGKKWQRFNRATYTNPNSSSKFFGLGPADFDSTAQILKDVEVNNGADVGSTIDVGSLECLVLMRVDE